ncbi:MAG: biotin synthase BioB [Prevotellaceae bacterium]|jgi:adenosylmethionine-8-amino-7-oxononanoate aminotransferase|nr:biotin synthase BioB [Prevotellaceae bacterium]
MLITELKEKVLAGSDLTPEEVCALAATPDKEALYAAAAEITRKCASRKYNLCCIRNAKSGRCSENCKWCAQSAHHNCQIEIYDLVDENDALQNLEYAKQKGIHKFSLVTSGKRLSDDEVKKIRSIYQKMNEQKEDCELCGSLGLLTKEQLQSLKDAGMQNYHCNLETAPSYFNTLCTTHTLNEKIQTLRWAKEVGLQICSGGIIGMGESVEQRIELAFELKKLNASSIPVNILDPIKGTKLEHLPKLSDEEILTAIALFRFINPTAYLRLSGGKASLSKEMQLKALQTGLNASITGGLLTTPGATTTEEDREMFEQFYEGAKAQKHEGTK